MDSVTNFSPDALARERQYAETRAMLIASGAIYACPDELRQAQAILAAVEAEETRQRTVAA